MKQLISDKTLVNIPGGQSSCEYAFFPGLELCAFLPEQVIFSYEAVVQQKPGSAIFISAADTAGLREQWQSIGSPIMIFASESDMSNFNQAVPEAQTVSIYEKFAEWNIFGNCVHHSYCISGDNQNAGKAVKALLQTMGAVINNTDSNAPVLTYDMRMRNSLLAEGTDAYFALELFFGTEPEDETEHNHDHQPKQLRSSAECTAALCSDAEQQQNIFEVCEVITNLFF